MSKISLHDFLEAVDCACLVGKAVRHLACSGALSFSESGLPGDELTLDGGNGARYFVKRREFEDVLFDSEDLEDAIKNAGPMEIEGMLVFPGRVNPARTGVYKVDAGRYAYWRGDSWGAFAHGVDYAFEFADEPAVYPPLFWCGLTVEDYAAISHANESRAPGVIEI